jgi:hypothetical protein
MTNTNTVNTNWSEAQKQCNSYNKPYAKTVAIVTSHIGDDNDYSCYLQQAIFALMEAGKTDIALKLANTDSMLVAPRTKESLLEWHQREIRLNEEDARNKEAQLSSYYKD